MAEIKELKETKQKEDDILLAIAAGNRQPVIPHLEFEYSDISIHEDLYKLVQYSCEEVCSTKEQVNKVMKLWTTFLEPMLGIPSQPHGTEGTEDVGKSNCPAMNCTASIVRESDGSSGGGAIVMNSKQPKAASNEDENTSPELANSCRTMANGDTVSKENVFLNVDHACRDDTICNTFLPENEQKNIDVTDKMTGLNTQVASGERGAHSNASFATGAEISHGKTSLEVTSGLYLGVDSTICILHSTLLCDWVGLVIFRVFSFGVF